MAGRVTRAGGGTVASVCCYTPVSYTHLDVYKRQFWTWQRFFLMVGNSFPWNSTLSLRSFLLISELPTCCRCVNIQFFERLRCVFYPLTYSQKFKHFASVVSTTLLRHSNNPSLRTIRVTRPEQTQFFTVKKAFFTLFFNVLFTVPH